MPTKAIPIDPALLAYFPPASRNARSSQIVPASVSPAPSSSPIFGPPTSTIGVGYGASGSTSTIGVGYPSTSQSAYPTLANLAASVPSAYDLAIDPALFQLEQAVKSLQASIILDAVPAGSGKGRERRAKRAKTSHRTEPAAAVEQPAPEATYIQHELDQAGRVLDADIDPTLQDGREGMVEDSGTGLGVEFDPTIREIVKSLTKAQENHPQDAHPAEAEMPSDADTNAALTQALTEAQTVAAISAHLVAAEGMDQDMQTSLADMTSEQLNSFFHQSPSSPNYLLSDYADAQQHTAPSHPLPLGQSELDAQITSALQSEAFQQASALASSSSAPLIQDLEANHADGDSDSVAGRKRKRGRPKGSKNKPKPYSATAIAPPLADSSPKETETPPKPEGPPKRMGRPPKQRTGEELEEYLKKKADKAAGVKKARGRPRKFPGYLVRDLRLKPNREEFREVVRRYAHDDPRGQRSSSQAEAWGEGSASGSGAAGGKGEYRELDMDGDQGGQEEEEYDWANDPHNLIDAVSGQMGDVGAGMGLGMEGMEVMEEGQQEEQDEPSANTGLGREGMGHVFGLESVEGEVET